MSEESKNTCRTCLHFGILTKACFGDEPHIRILKAVTVEAARAESESGDISNEALAELDAVDVIKTSGLDEKAILARLVRKTHTLRVAQLKYLH